MVWNWMRSAKRRPAADPASVSSAQEARPAAADPVPKRRRAAPLLDLPPAAQARALVSLLQEEDHGIENQIRNPEMRQIHRELCARGRRRGHDRRRRRGPGGPSGARA